MRFSDLTDYNSTIENSSQYEKNCGHPNHTTLATKIDGVSRWLSLAHSQKLKVGESPTRLSVSVAQAVPSSAIICHLFPALAELGRTCAKTSADNGLQKKPTMRM